MGKRLRRALALLALAGAIALALAYRDRFDAATLQAWVADAGSAGPLLFMAIYALANGLLLPGAILTFAGGALFGPLWGTFYNLTGATLGAGLAFLAARYLASGWVQARVGAGTQGGIERLVRGVEAEGWRFVAFTRLVPLFPFNLLNYALGLTRIPFLQYLIATYVFMLPGAVAYTYLGYAGREAVGGGEALIQKGLIALALLAAVAFLPRLVGRLRERPWLTVEGLKERLDTGAGLLLDVRTTAEFDGELGHIHGALNLPLEDLPEHLEELVADPARPIAIVCRTDRRSAKALALLTQWGFANAQVVRGGMTAWLEQGWPVERM